MKKILTIAAIVVVGVYGVACIGNEMRVNNYVSATAAYVDGARRNGAITPDECDVLKGHLSYCWLNHAYNRMHDAQRIRRMVKQAYAEQKANQPEPEFKKLETCVSYRMLSK